MTDYGCKTTAPGRGHRHSCDQPATHPLGAELHWCDQCEHWWRPAVDGNGVATIADDTRTADQAVLW